MADTFSFDVVSDFDRQELVNTVDQVRREVSQRYDLKDSGTVIDLEDTCLTITTASDMTLQAAFPSPGDSRRPAADHLRADQPQAQAFRQGAGAGHR